MNRQARNKAYADRTADARKLKAAIKSVQQGRKPRQATLDAFGWTEEELRLIRDDPEFVASLLGKRNSQSK